MFSELFQKFKKSKKPVLKTEEELVIEFEKVKRDYANIASSKLYELIREYFEAKIEINRDALELLLVGDPNQAEKIRYYQSQIKVMRDFIKDIEGMKAELDINNQA